MANVYAVDVRINLRRGLPDLVYEAVSKNPHRIIAVTVLGQYGLLSDNSDLSILMNSDERQEIRDFHQRRSDGRSASIYHMDEMHWPFSIHQSVAYHAFLRSLSQGKPYVIIIDTKSLKDSIPGGQQVVVKFRLVWVRVWSLKASQFLDPFCFPFSFLPSATFLVQSNDSKEALRGFKQGPPGITGYHRF